MCEVTKMKESCISKKYKIFINILSILALVVEISCTLPDRECRGPRCNEEMRYYRDSNRGRNYISGSNSSYERYGSNPRSGRQYSDEAIDYFLEIGFGSELEDSKYFSLVDFFIETQLRSSFWEMQTRPVVKKWYEDLYIKFHDEYTQEDIREVKKIARELSELTGLQITTTSGNANVNIYFKDIDEATDQIRDSSSFNINNYNGLVWPITDHNFVYYEATIFIDKTARGNKRRSVIREELTQALGLLKDSYAHSDSIFHHHSDPVEFAEVDKEVILLLYDDRIQPGMTRLDVKRALGIIPNYRNY